MLENIYIVIGAAVFWAITAALAAAFCLVIWVKLVDLWKSDFVEYYIKRKRLGTEEMREASPYMFAKWQPGIRRGSAWRYAVKLRAKNIRDARPVATDYFDDFSGFHAVALNFTGRYPIYRGDAFYFMRDVWDGKQLYIYYLKPWELAEKRAEKMFMDRQVSENCLHIPVFVKGCAEIASDRQPPGRKIAAYIKGEPLFVQDIIEAPDGERFVVCDGANIESYISRRDSSECYLESPDRLWWISEMIMYRGVELNDCKVIGTTFTTPELDPRDPLDRI